MPALVTYCDCSPDTDNVEISSQKIKKGPPPVRIIVHHVVNGRNHCQVLCDAEASEHTHVPRSRKKRRAVLPRMASKTKSGDVSFICNMQRFTVPC